MKTDSLFYRLFQEVPAILLQLGGLSPAESAQQAPAYTFRSVELKQTAFRIDGVLFPTDPYENPVWFAEVQFQKDQLLYHRLFSELHLFLRQNPDIADWRVVVLFPRHNLEPDRTDLHREMLQSDRVLRVFIEDLPDPAHLPLEVALVKLINEPESKAIEVARNLLERVPQEEVENLSSSDLMELIKTIIVYKFERLSREEIEAMLGLADLKRTKVYQEALEEGLEQGLSQGLEQGQKRDRYELVRPLLEKLFANLDETLEEAIVLLSELSPDRFLSVLLALAQPPEHRRAAIVSVWQARFNAVPEGLPETLNELTEAELVEELKKAIVSLRN